MPRGVARSGVIGRVELRKALLGFSSRSLELTKSRARGYASTAAALAKNTGRQTILSTPSSLSPGKPDRYWTGDMFRAYDAQVTETGNRITVKWGWIDERKKYFKTQEYGGFAFGKTVTPMHALANSSVVVQNYLADKGIK